MIDAGITAFVLIQSTIKFCDPGQRQNYLPLEVGDDNSLVVSGGIDTGGWSSFHRNIC